MVLVLLLSRAVLAAVLAAAGLAKPVDRAGSRETLAGFDVPRHWIRREVARSAGRPRRHRPGLRAATLRRLRSPATRGSAKQR